MGCSGSRITEEGIHAPLEYQMDDIEVVTIDKIFKLLQKSIEELEEIRQAVVDNEYDVIISTGAAANISPDIENCFYSLAWKISTDNAGKFVDSGLNFDINTKSIILTGDNNTDEAKIALHRFNQYVAGIWNLPERLNNVSDNLSQQTKYISDNEDKYTNEISAAFKENIMKVPGKINSYKMNKDKGIKALKVAGLVTTELTKNIEFIKEIPKLIREPEKLKSIDEIGDKSYQKKLASALEIVWHNLSPKERYGKKPVDGLRFWDDRKENKKIIKEKTHRKK